MKTPNINKILRSNLKNMTRGAPMGDSGYINDDQPLTGLLCQRVNMVDGDYTPDGTYWGYSPKHGQECIMSDYQKGYSDGVNNKPRKRYASLIYQWGFEQGQIDALTEYLEENQQ